MVDTHLTRNDLAKLFKGVGVEVGVERAVFAKEIAKHCDKLYCVDAWKTYPNYRESVTQERLDEFYEQTKQRMQSYNCEIIRKFSMDAVKDFEDESLDFVYLDANHKYQSVVEDIREWSKKVKRGGIVAGHDYVNVFHRDGLYGVIKAVDELDEEVTIWRGDRSPSWSYIK